jgi:site-specific DNA-methyltransferase (adenine-specific)
MKPYYEDKWVKIYHGDCREILPQLDVKADLALTDPPYGAGRKYGDSYNDTPNGYWEWFLPTLDLILTKGNVTAVHHLPSALKRINTWDWLLVWHKPYGAGARVGNSPILPHWEIVFLWGIHKLGTQRPVLQDWISCNPEPSPRPQLSISPREADLLPSNGHPLPKPIELEAKLIAGLSSPANLVLDPFVGSGTTCFCAKKLNRYSIGIEIEERYCEIAAKRCSQDVMELTV